MRPRERGGLDCTPLGQFLHFTQRALRFANAPHAGSRLDDARHREWKSRRRNASLEHGERLVIRPQLQERKPLHDERSRIVGSKIERSIARRDRFSEPVGLEERKATRLMCIGPERVQLDGALAVRDRFVRTTEIREKHRVVGVRGRRAGPELDCPIEAALGTSPIPVEPVPDIRESRVRLR